MTQELIIKLIEKAKGFAENAYCPYTNVAVGCSLVAARQDSVDVSESGNVIFGGCNIENGVLSSSADAGEVAVFKAISEAHTKFLAICFWSAARMPYPSGRVRQLLSEFGCDIDMVFATDKTYSLQKLSDIFPLPPEVNVD